MSNSILGTKFSEIWIEVKHFHSRKCILKNIVGKFCLGLNVLTNRHVLCIFDPQMPISYMNEHYAHSCLMNQRCSLQWNTLMTKRVHVKQNLFWL